MRIWLVGVAEIKYNSQKRRGGQLIEVGSARNNPNAALILLQIDSDPTFLFETNGIGRTSSNGTKSGVLNRMKS